MATSIAVTRTLESKQWLAHFVCDLAATSRNTRTTRTLESKQWLVATAHECPGSPRLELWYECPFGGDAPYGVSSPLRDPIFQTALDIHTLTHSY